MRLNTQSHSGSQPLPDPPSSPNQTPPGSPKPDPPSSPNQTPPISPKPALPGFPTPPGLLKPTPPASPKPTPPAMPKEKAQTTKTVHKKQNQKKNLSKQKQKQKRAPDLRNETAMVLHNKTKPALSSPDDPTLALLPGSPSREVVDFTAPEQQQEQSKYTPLLGTTPWLHDEGDDIDSPPPAQDHHRQIVASTASDTAGHAFPDFEVTPSAKRTRLSTTTHKMDCDK